MNSDNNTSSQTEAAKQSSLATKIVRGMVIVLFFWLFWKFGGFLLGVIIGNLYPPGEPAADAYAHVYKIIIFGFFYSSALKMLVPAFMPMFIDRMKKDGEAAAWEFAYSVINMVLVVAVVVSALGIVAAPRIIGLLVPGFSIETKGLCVSLMRIMLPGCIGMLLSMVAMPVLHSYKIFSYPAAGDAAQKLVWAAALFLGVKLLKLDARTVAYGFLAGCVVQLIINGFGLRKKRGFYRPLVSNPHFPRFLKELGILSAFGGAFFAAAYWSRPIVEFLGDLIDPRADAAVWQRMFIFSSGLVLACSYSGLLWARARKKSSVAARFAALMAPVIIGVVFARYRDVVTSVFQSFTKSGVFADVEFSKNIGNFPIVLVAYGLSVAMFPYLCDLASGKDMKTFGALVTRALRMIAIFFIPLSIAMILLNKPIIALVYDRGNWSDIHVGYAATALAFYIFALFFYAIENVVLHSYFSMQRMWMPTLLGIVAALVQVAFLFIGIRVLNYSHPYDIFLAVTLAYPVSRIFKNVTLLAILRLRIPILPLRRTAIFAAKLAVVCLAFAAVVYGSNHFLEAAAPMGDFKKTDIVIDTFSTKNTNWTSRDADRIAVEDRPDGATTLAVTYRPLANREISIDRDLSLFRLDDVSHVIFRCRASQPGEVIIEIDFAKGTWRSPPMSIATEWRGTADLATVPSGMGRATRLSLVLPMRGGEPGRALFGLLRRRTETDARTLLLKELSFRSGGRDITIDAFAQPSPQWHATHNVLLVADTGEGDEGEQALLLVDDHTPRRASRDLFGYDLRNAAAIGFKVKSGGGGELLLELFDRAGNRFEKAVAVDASESRKSYAVALDEFPGAVDPSQFETVRFSFTPFGEMPERLWLDNVTFAAARGFVDGLSFQYELVKFVHVALPCLLGGIVLIVLIFLLRIEEGRLVFDWLIRQGREKLGKLARRGSGE